MTSTDADAPIVQDQESPDPEQAARNTDTDRQ